MASTVTFTGADFPRTRRVVVDGRQFPLNTPVKNVSDDTVNLLKSLPGHKFKVESSDPPAKGDKKES